MVRLAARRMVGVSGRLEKWLDVEAGLHWLRHQWRPVGIAVCLLVAAFYGLSGLAIIRPDERAVVRQFGRVLPNDLNPGLHLCWPWPVDVVTHGEARPYCNGRSRLPRYADAERQADCTQLVEYAWGRRRSPRS